MQSERNIKRKKILVICPHPVGYAPGQRLKYEQYFDTFREAGYDIIPSGERLRSDFGCPTEVV